MPSAMPKPAAPHSKPWLMMKAVPTTSTMPIIQSISRRLPLRIANAAICMGMLVLTSMTVKKMGRNVSPWTRGAPLVGSQCRVSACSASMAAISPEKNMISEKMKKMIPQRAGGIASSPTRKLRTGWTRRAGADAAIVSLPPFSALFAAPPLEGACPW